jgi:hypothetical protein
MQSVAPIMMRSPRHAPGGASASAVISAAATPSIASRMPSVLRRLKSSTRSSAPAIMVISGSVDRARVPRATVV